MSKGMAVVVAYSIFLLVLFCVMCYLMSTINPLPLTIIEHHTANGTRRFLDLNLKPLIVEKLATDDNVEYGLEKVRDDEYLSSHAYPLYLYSTARIEGFNGPDIFETVQPPVWPPQTISRNIVHLPIIIMEENDTPRLEFETASIKAYRRSVNNNVDDYRNAIIFKVLHGNSRPRIEIKLDNDKKSKINKSNLKFAESFPPDNDKDMEKPKLRDYKIIKMISNDTVVIYDDENPSESNKKDYIQDIKTLNEKTKHITKHTIIDIKNEIQSITHRNQQKYALNVSLSDSGKFNVHNVTNGTKS